MRQLLTIVFFLTANLVFAQTEQLDKILKKANPNPSDKIIQSDFNYQYDTWESDSCIIGKENLKYYINSLKYKEDSTLANAHLYLIYFNYLKANSDYKTGLFWMKALCTEYKKVYGELHPYLILCQGQLMNNLGMKEEVYKYFMDFHTQYPKSVMALYYVYQTEKDKEKAANWLKILKTERPNHYYVKKL